MFKTFISQRAVREAVDRYQREGYVNSNTYPYWVMADVVKDYLPDGCDEAYAALLNTPGITDQELVDLIMPPIEIISPIHKSVGLSTNPEKAYERFIHRIGGDELADDVDPLFFNDAGLYLRISPLTTVTELREFISKYFEEEMEPHLGEQPIGDTKYSAYMNNPNSKLRRAVARKEPRNQRILELKAVGKSAREIREIILEEFDEYIDDQNIRKIISIAKKKNKT